LASPFPPSSPPTGRNVEKVTVAPSLRTAVFFLIGKGFSPPPSHQPSLLEIPLFVVPSLRALWTCFFPAQAFFISRVRECRPPDVSCKRLGKAHPPDRARFFFFLHTTGLGASVAPRSCAKNDPGHHHHSFERAAFRRPNLFFFFTKRPVSQLCKVTVQLPTYG